MQQYIAGNVEYPHEAIEMNEQGRVYLSFIIEMDGTISHVKVERGVSDTLDYEAVRLLYRMPKWIFGSCSGEPVRTKGRLPISFTLN